MQKKESFDDGELLPFGLKISLVVGFGAIFLVFPTMRSLLSVPRHWSFFMLGLLATSLYIIFVTFFKKQILEKHEDGPIYRLFQARTYGYILLLSWLLYAFDRINGPLYVLLLPLVIQSAWTKDPEHVKTSAAIIAALAVVEFSYQMVMKTIVVTPVSFIYLSGRLIALAGVSFYGLVLVDYFRDKKQANEETKRADERLESVTKNLKITNTKLQDLSKLKDEFVSVASHELRAPMTTIKGYISMILDGDAGQVPAKVVEYLKSAYDSSERMIRLVNNMLNVSRIESGRLIMSLSDIQIENAIEDVVNSFALEAKNHGLELKYFKPRKRLPKVRLDPDRVREVIANLVSNAINFTSHGHIHIRAVLEGVNVIVSVEDTGMGIAPEDQRQLFKKFSQVGLSAPLKKGSGLGLYICRMLINEFGGDIWLKSKPGKGTTFYFSLPAINSHSTEEVE